MSPDNRLIEWAEAEGFTLRPLELELLVNVIHGKAVCGKTGFLSKKDHKPDVACADDHTISAILLSRLILDEKAKGAIHPYGIRIHGAYFDKGELNLDTARIPFPLLLQGCYIPKRIELRDANTRLLSFRGSHTGPIDASRIVVKSSLALNEGFWAKGEVRLHGAHIKGQFDCRKARFDNPVSQNQEIHEQNRYALMANGIKVDCDVYLSDVTAFGTVMLSGAVISDDLECDGGHFFNSKGKALEADRIQIGGHIYFTVSEGNDKYPARYFKVLGQVSLIQAKINGSLFCRFAFLYRKGQVALDAREANIAGSAWFYGFKTNGLIRLTGSAIEGCLYFVDAQFFGERRTGLIGKAFIVKGQFLWTSINKTPTTQLDLRSSWVGRLEDDAESWPEAGNLMLDGFVYNSIITRITKEIRTTQKSSFLNSVGSWISRSKYLNRLKPWIFQKTGLNKKKLRLREQTRIDWLERQLSERFTGDDIDNFPGLVHKIIHSSDAVSKRLKSRLLKEDVETIDRNMQKNNKQLSTIDENVILLGLNDLLQDKHLVKVYRKEEQLLLEGHRDIQELIEQSEKNEGLDRQGWAQLNCWILKKVYPQIKEEAKPLRRYFREQPYEQLALFLLAQGKETEAKEILIAKNDAKRKYGNLPLYERFFMDRYKCMTRYGYKPLRAAWKGMIFIFIGGLAFMAGYEEGLMVPSKEYVYMNKPYRTEKGGDVRGELPSTYPEFDPLVYSLETFVPFLDLHQKGYWLPLSKGDTRQDAIKRREDLERRSQTNSIPWYSDWIWLPLVKPIFNTIPETLKPVILHLWMWFEIIIGWVLSTFFVAGVLGLMHDFHLRKKE